MKMLVRKFTGFEELRDRNGICVRGYRWTQSRRICVLDAPARERKRGVGHTLNLLRGLQVDQKLIAPTDLRAEAQRLIAAGRMPSPDELLGAVASARRKYRPQIIAARKLAKKRGTPDVRTP